MTLWLDDLFIYGFMTEKLHITLREDGAVKALLEMARSGNIDVIAQVARGLANFAKCESRGTIQGLHASDVDVITIFL